MEIYKVGGAVRDSLLGEKPSDSDWVVIGSSPEEMILDGFKPIGKDFPVFLHPETKEEYALARTEKKSGYGYKGFNFYCGKDVTLEDDLRRRDLTINAIAQDKNGKIIDPFMGIQDLENKVFRHVSKAFSEDPLRAIRLARFKSYGHLNSFEVSKQTSSIINEIVKKGEIGKLSSDRLWSEINKALSSQYTDAFFKMILEYGMNKDFLQNLCEPMCKIGNSNEVKWAELEKNNAFSLSKNLPVPKDYISACNVLKLILKINICVEIDELSALVQKINFKRNENIIRDLLEIDSLQDSHDLIISILEAVKDLDFSNLKNISPDMIQEEKREMYNKLLLEIL